MSHPLENNQFSTTTEPSRFRRETFFFSRKQFLGFLFVSFLVGFFLAFFTSAHAATLPLNQGGTGTTTSTKGDLLVGTSSKQTYTELHVGSNGKVLTASSTAPAGISWESSGASLVPGVDYITPAQLGADTFRDFHVVNGYLTPTTTRGILINASSTIGCGNAYCGLTVSGNATTTGDAILQGNIKTSLATGWLLNTSGGAVSVFTGVTCTNQLLRNLTAGGTAVCSAVDLTADVANALPEIHGGTGVSLIAQNMLLASTGNLIVATSTPTMAAFFATSTTATSIIAGYLKISPTGGLIIPVAANVGVPLAGQIAVENTAASTSLRFADADGTSRALFAVRDRTVVLASSTLVKFGAFGAAGSSTINLMNNIRPTRLTSFYCKTDTGTLWLGFGNGTATTSEAQCTASGTLVNVSSNNTWNERQNFIVEVGHSASTPNSVTVTAEIEERAD